MKQTKEKYKITKTDYSFTKSLAEKNTNFINFQMALYKIKDNLKIIKEEIENLWCSGSAVEKFIQNENSINCDEYNSSSDEENSINNGYNPSDDNEESSVESNEESFSEED